ncbi:MAG: PHP domain-containing protein [Clostridia bacterium]|nr:PHP domain-containing protein [Clostridia bacterium]
MRPIIDLHMHTTASDGTQTPSELLEAILKKNIALFSITDHDSISNIDEMILLANEANVKFIPGVEVSAMYKGQEFHLLTYGIRTDDAELMKILSTNQIIRDDHNRKVIEYVSTFVPEVSTADYDAYERNPKSGGWKSENYLSDKNVTQSLNDFFDIVSKMDEQLVFPRLEEVLPKLVKLGYPVILAHPPAYNRRQFLSFSTLDELRHWGISGIECYSPYFRFDSDTTYYRNYCKRNNMMITSGSDHHGDFIPARVLGIPRILADQISYDRLLKLAR